MNTSILKRKLEKMNLKDFAFFELFVKVMKVFNF